MRSCCARRTRMRGSAASTRAARRAPGRARGADRRGSPRRTDCSRCGPTAEANTVRPASRSPLRRSRCWPTDKVRYVGEPVALIVAETREQALDAAELVAVDYVPLPAVTTPRRPRAPGAPQVADEAPGNLCFDWRTGDSAAVDAAFAARRPCRHARGSTTTASSPTRWSRAASSGS